MTERKSLVSERAELVAAIEAATSWGAAVGARSERIKEIDQELRRLATQDQKPVATFHIDGSFIKTQWHVPVPNKGHIDVYPSPPPAAGWNEAIEAAVAACKEVQEGMSDECDFGAGIAAKKVEALRHTAPPDSGAGKSEPTIDVSDFSPENICRALSVSESVPVWIRTLASSAKSPDHGATMSVPATIPTCCVTGAIPGDGGACDDCDPCIMGEPLVPEAVKRLIAEKNSLLQRVGEMHELLNPELPDHGGADAGVNVSRDVLLTLISVLDCALGDTDPSIDPDYTDDEVKRDYPVFWVCQQLTALSKPAPVDANASAEQTITENPDGSVSLDEYAGWSREQLKDRCRELIANASAEARLREALEFIRDGYANQDVSHVDYRVKTYEVALDALSLSHGERR